VGLSDLTNTQIEVLQAVAEWANRFPCIRVVYVFGSFARGHHAPNDLDIAVEFTEDVVRRTAVECYTDVNLGSTDLERALAKILSVSVGWTGLTVLRDGYDHRAWAAIRAGRLLQCSGKARMIWTEPTPQPHDAE
jgi:predicted nucleotidyltransferase